MVQPKAETTAVTDMIKQAQNTFTTNPMIGERMTHIIEAQQGILNEAEEFSKHWFERRKEAAETAVKAAKDIFGNGASDPAAPMSVISDWQKHSMERMTADLQDWVDFCARCTGKITKSETKTKQ
jgi:hypothetical protein